MIVLKSIIQKMTLGEMNLLAKRLLTPVTSLILVAVMGLSSLTAAESGAKTYAQEWGPAVGTPLPLLQAQDQNSQEQTLASLTGKQGLLLFLNRSADW